MGEKQRAGRFLVLDGIDGCGKSTQAALLVEALTPAGGPAPLHLREPGSTAAGERIRELLLARGVEIGAAAETLLFAAARRQMLDERVRPALAAGRDVVCERFNSSTYAYQAVAGELDEQRVLALLGEWAGEPAPEMVLVLDLDPGAAAARRGADGDRIEDKGLEFQRRVAEGYRRYAERVPGVRLIDARGSADEVAQRVLAEVRGAG